MPSTKRKSTYSRTDSFIASDSDSSRPHKSSKPSATVNQAKRSKPTTTFTSASSITKSPKPETDSDGNPYWSLSNTRRVTVSDFKSKKMVSIREYYEKDGNQLPGKKGITMTIEQYAELVKCLPGIERALGKEASGVLGRPRYDDQKTNGDEDDEGDELGMEAGHDEGDEDEDGEQFNGRAQHRKGRKANIEATSDEDEDDG